jgi:hypothetical protein
VSLSVSLLPLKSVYEAAVYHAQVVSGYVGFLQQVDHVLVGFAKWLFKLALFPALTDASL